MNAVRVQIRRRRSWGALLAALALCAGTLSAVALTPGVSGAEESQNGGDMIVINPGGGADPTGADGLQIVLNGNDGYTGTPGAEESVPVDGSDQVYFADTSQWCCSGASPQLNIGGTLYGEAGASYNKHATSWDSTTIVSVSGAIGRASAGSGTPDDTTTQGSGSAHLRYSVEHSSLTYTLDRYVSYTFPNNYYTDSFTLTIPAGNSEVVKFYNGGDAAPGNSDHGSGFGVGPAFSTTAPQNGVYEVNTDSGIYISYSDVLGGGTADGLYAGQYRTPVYDQIYAGDDIGFVVNPSDHDAGLDLQKTFGSTPGTYTYTHKTTVDFQGTSVSAAFDPAEVAAGETAELVFEVLNTEFSPVPGIGFALTLPAGLTVAGAATNDCGGTATAAGSSVSLAGASIDAAAVCYVRVPVTGVAGATYTVEDQDIVPTALTVGYGVSTLTVTGSTPTPEPTPEPTFTG
jgi:hypothetical protein